MAVATCMAGGVLLNSNPKKMLTRTAPSPLPYPDSPTEDPMSNNGSSAQWTVRGYCAGERAGPAGSGRVNGGDGLAQYP